MTLLPPPPLSIGREPSFFVVYAFLQVTFESFVASLVAILGLHKQLESKIWQSVGVLASSTNLPLHQTLSTSRPRRAVEAFTCNSERIHDRSAWPTKTYKSKPRSRSNKKGRNALQLWGRAHRMITFPRTESEMQLTGEELIFNLVLAVAELRQMRQQQSI